MVSLYLRSWQDPGHGGHIQGEIEGSWRELWQLRKPFKVLKQRGGAVRNKRENNILCYEKLLIFNPANRWFLWHESKQNTIVLVVRTALLPFLSPHYHILLLFTHCLSPALPSSRLHFLAIISSIFRYSRPPHPTCWVSDRVCDHTLFESNNSPLQYTRVSISTSGRNKRHS